MKECNLWNTKKIKDEKHFLLDCPTYTQIRSQFQNIFHTTNLPNLLTQQNYGDIEKLLLIFFEHKNNDSCLHLNTCYSFQSCCQEPNQLLRHKKLCMGESTRRFNEFTLWSLIIIFPLQSAFPENW
jgi:hypothetical protein